MSFRRPACPHDAGKLSTDAVRIMENTRAKRNRHPGDAVAGDNDHSAVGCALARWRRDLHRGGCRLRGRRARRPASRASIRIWRSRT